MTKDLTRGNPAKLIVSFTLPLLIGNLFQQFYNMADTFIVGRTLGVNALAAVGSTGSLSFLILGFVMGFTSGLAIVTAKKFGAGDAAGVRKSFFTGLILSLVFTVVLTLVSVLCAMPLLKLLRTPDEIITDAHAYISVIFWGIGAQMLFNLFSNTLRAVGNSRAPLLFLVVACVLNIGLDYLFIIPFGMGVRGAGIATVIAQLFASLLCIPYLIKKGSVLRLKKSDCTLSQRDIKEHAKFAMPMGFQSSIIAIGAVAVQFALNGLGTNAVAAFTAAQKIDTFATMPLMSFGITMATFSSQNYGAGKIDRIKKGLIQCILISLGVSVTIGLINIFAGQYLAAIFVESEPAVTSLAHTYLIVNGALYSILGLLFVFRYTLQGLGKTLVPTIAGVMELIMRIFAAIILTRYFGFVGVSFASPLAWLGAMVPMMIALIFTLKKMLKNPPVVRVSEPTEAV